jgi:hypothetical protein
MVSVYEDGCVWGREEGECSQVGDEDGVIACSRLGRLFRAYSDRAAGWLKAENTQKLAEDLMIMAFLFLPSSFRTSRSPRPPRPVWYCSCPTALVQPTSIPPFTVDGIPLSPCHTSLSTPRSDLSPSSCTRTMRQK